MKLLEFVNISMDFSDVVKNLINEAAKSIKGEDDKREAEELIALFSESTLRYYRTRAVDEKAAWIPFKVRKYAKEVELPQN